MTDLPQKLQGEDRKGRIDYCVERLINRTDYKPSKKYNLLRREEHQIPESMSHLEDIQSNSLLKPTEHWERTGYKFRLPLYKDTPPNRKSIHEIQTKKDFVKWFEQKYEGIGNGVYGAIQRNGKGHGTTNLFLLRVEAGSVIDWRKKSNTQETSSEGKSANYYAIPFYLRMISNYV